ncbi:MAG: hypothetical protein KIIPBIDF_00451 [Candidatus Methanoperedenaceae archaeon GB50]|nr:MAG: hypothetical protein KIIPBIDF_00451 [Candidatus Methanoperedenaceae archaeon GB50]
MKKLCTSGSKACLFPPAVGQGQTGIFSKEGGARIYYMGIALHVLKPEI